MNVNTAVSLLLRLYLEDHGKTMPEWRMQRCLYLANRERLLESRCRESLFSEPFYAAKNGPMLKSVQQMYLADALPGEANLELADAVTLSNVYHRYESYTDWKLCTLVTNEFCWEHARTGQKPDGGAVNVLRECDMALDAMRAGARLKTPEQYYAV